MICIIINLNTRNINYGRKNSVLNAYNGQQQRATKRSPLFIG